MVMAALVVAVFIFRRDALVWTPGWLCLAITGAFDIAADRFPLLYVAASFTGTLFPFVMLVGALRFAEERGERVALWVGVAAGALRAAFAAAGLGRGAETIAFVIDPIPFCVGGVVVLRFAIRRRAGVADFLVGPALLLLAGVEIYSGYRQLFLGDPPQFTLWLSFVVPVAVAQFYAAIAHSQQAQEEVSRALEKNETRFRLLTENSRDLISEMGPDDRLTYASPNHVVLGVEVSDIVGKRVEELGHLMEANAEDPNQEMPTRPGTFDTISKVRTPAGEIRWFDTNSTASFDEQGGRHILSISRDVTDRIRAAEAERDSRERLRTILASLPSTRVNILGRDLSVRALVPAEADFGRFGHKWSEVEGGKIDQFLPPECAEEWRTGIEEVLETGEPRKLRQEIRLAEATLFYDTVLSRLGAEETEAGLVLAVSHEVTDEVRADAERREFELRREQAQKFESLGLLASGIAHDFNNLLVGIAGNVELAQRKVEEGSDLAPRLQDIAKASKRAAELTEQLLAYAGKADLQVEPLDLSALIEDTAQLLRSNVPASAELLVEPSDPPAWINADGTQVRQVVMNLVSNAAEAIGQGGTRIVARSGKMHVDRGYLDECHPAGGLGPGTYSFLEVEDDGPGMPPETVARIFEPFYSSHGLGRGLGLSVVLGVVKSHGGTVHVDSRIGGGTRFRVLFPPAESGVDESVSDEAHDTSPGSGTVLLVDDEDTVRHVARQFLEIGGFDVVEARGGAEALDLFLREPDTFQAALLDVSMPGMTGPETLDALRAVRGELPVVFMSGHSATDMGKIDEGSARTGRVRKPFGITDLQQALRAVISA